MAKFKVGDKVIAKKGAPYAITTNGWRGVVTRIRKDSGTMYVSGQEFRGKLGTSVESKYFDLDTSCNQKIVITADGMSTTAKLYDGKTVIKTATAKCSPDDTFDFETGARIAFDRLTGYVVPVVPVAPARENIFDWDGFKKGKFAVSVNKDNIRAFRAEAKKYALTFGDDDEIFDPFASDFTVVLELFHAKSVSPKNERLIIVDSGYLKIQLPSTLSSLEVVRW